MQTQVEATQRQVIALAKVARGVRTREEFFGDFEGISFNTYANFESGSTWPRARTLRQIEKLLGWEDGIIDKVLESGIEPTALTLAHMRGDEPLHAPTSDLAEKPWTDLVAEMNRVTAEMQRRIAASQGGEDGIGPEDAPEE